MMDACCTKRKADEVIEALVEVDVEDGISDLVREMGYDLDDLDVCCQWWDEAFKAQLGPLRQALDRSYRGGGEPKERLDALHAAALAAFRKMQLHSTQPEFIDVVLEPDDAGAIVHHLLYGIEDIDRELVEYAT